MADKKAGKSAAMKGALWVAKSAVLKVVQLDESSENATAAKSAVLKVAKLAVSMAV